MATSDQHGPSYPLWHRIQRELDRQGVSQRALVEHTGVTHTVIRDLRTTGIRDRVARRANALAIARFLGIPEDEALQLAGLVDTPVDPDADVRATIAASALDEDQKRALYAMLDVFDRDRPSRGRSGETTPTRDRLVRQRINGQSAEIA